MSVAPHHFLLEVSPAECQSQVCATATLQSNEELPGGSKAEAKAPVVTSSPHFQRYSAKPPQKSLESSKFGQETERPIDTAPTTLDSYIRKAVLTGFVIQALKPQFARQKRPVLQQGYSIRDWHSKIELRKKRLSFEIPKTKIPQSEVESHRTSDTLWVVVRGVVYDVTEFQRFHPCFDNVLEKCSGHDITALVEVFHPWITVHSFLMTYAIGWLEVQV